MNRTLRPHRWAGWLPALAVVLGGAFAAGPLAAATLTCGTASAIAGQNVSVALTASDLTGLNVRSYEFDISYNPGVVTATGVTTAGTLTGTAGWGTPTINVTSGKIRIAGSGANALTGTGVMLNVTFHLDPAWVNGNSTGLALANLIFNEGTPAATMVSGSITVTPTPQIFVAPNQVELARGQTQQFNASGNVVLPVTWSTTNATVASINSSGLLTANAVGTARVNASDNGGHVDQSDGDVTVRVSSVAIGASSVFLGQPVAVPVTTTSLTGGGVRSGELQITFPNNYLTLTSVTRQAGTLLNGYGSFLSGVTVSGTTSTLTVDFAGTTDLAGAGTLFFLNFTASPVNASFIGLGLNSVLFNETMPTLRTNGTVNITAPNAFSVNPGTITMYAGQTQQFTTSGSPVLPLVWSTLDPTVATINSSTGLLTAVAGGVTQVKAVDNVGGTGLNYSVTVYDFALTMGTITAPPGVLAHIPIDVDRNLAPLGVQAIEYVVNWTSPNVTSVTPTASGLVSSWGSPTLHPAVNQVRVVAASGTPLSGSGVLQYVDVMTNPATPNFTDIPFTLTSVLFNEGHPIPFITGGLLRVRTTAGVDDGPVNFAFAPVQPNPAVGIARFAFTLPKAASGGASVRLAVFGADGRLVRTLLDGPLGAGAHQVTWDARTADGSPVGVGVYFARLEWAGQTLERKVAVLK